MRLLGIDPGLQRTGWGVIEAEGSRLRALGCGTLRSTAGTSLASRLAELYAGLEAVLAEWQPDEAAVEETFVNKNPDSTLKLGHARAVALLVPARAGLPVHEYATNLVKKSVVGAGHADKDQVASMVVRLLPGIETKGADSTDALAVAICHAHHRQTKALWTEPPRPSGERDGVRGAQQIRKDRGGSDTPLTQTLSPEGRGLYNYQAKPSETAIATARRLRADQTDVEAKLWSKLRNRQLGVKFRRQEAIAGFVADFCCLEQGLIIELDGGQHTAQIDARRTAVLTQAGFRIIRFWNNEVTENLEGVLQRITEHLGAAR